MYGDVGFIPKSSLYSLVWPNTTTYGNAFRVTVISRCGSGTVPENDRPMLLLLAAAAAAPPPLLLSSSSSVITKVN